MKINKRNYKLDLGVTNQLSSVCVYKDTFRPEAF